MAARRKPPEAPALIGLELTRQGRIEQLERALDAAIKALEEGRRGDAMKALRAARAPAAAPPARPTGGKAA